MKEDNSTKNDSTTELKEMAILDALDSGNLELAEKLSKALFGEKMGLGDYSEYACNYIFWILCR
jgi:hypothetical protein